MHLPFFGRPRHQQVEKLYRDLAPALVAYARSLGFDHGSSEDIVHRTFLALMEMHTLPNEPRPYLFRAVRNGCLNQHREHAKHSEMPDDTPWFEGKDRIAELDLRRSLAQLPEDQREVLMLHVWGGLTFDEIASALAIPANTAASRYRYALAALKRAMTSKEKI
jgi:RNA polymerase sigma-70 factor (ECF subfamily)